MIPLIQRKMIHYANMNNIMQYAEIFMGGKKIILEEKFDIFLIFAQNLNCGYTFFLRGSAIYVLKQNQEKMYAPVNPSITIYQVSFCKNLNHRTAI